MELNSTDHTAPAWLAGHQQAQQKEVKPNFQGFVEPRMWPQDDGARREPVMDMDAKPPRAVRYVGWRKCMRCGQLFWSEDVQRLRLCTTQPNRQGCRNRQDDDGI